jgi:hypothetical protein
LISLTTGTSFMMTNIEHRDCSSAHKTIILHPSPNGNQHPQAQELKLKSHRFAAGMIKAPPSEDMMPAPPTE